MKRVLIYVEGQDVDTQVLLDDARRLEQVNGKFELVITSPPYPNRHDYSRIFHIELLSLGLGEEEIKRFRKESIRSHVEAAPPSYPLPAGDDRKRSGTSGYKMPSSLQEVLSRLPANADPRIASLLQGYFEDIYLVLNALHDHLKPGAICAFVVGNVRHAGAMVPVDQILGDAGEQIGFVRETIWVVRLRGNSAQQMGRFGRELARESVVFLRTDQNA